MTRKDLAFLGIAIIACFAVYVQALTYEFVYDDIPLIRDNTELRSISNLPGMLMREDTLDGARTGYYRPVVTAVDMLTYKLFGQRAGFFHLANICYHLVSVVFLYLLILKIFGASEAALMGALFFGLHPANTEAVVFITGKNNLLCLLFVLGSALAHLRYRKDGGMGWLLVAVASFGLGVFTKEFALMLPFIIAGYEVSFPRGRGRKWWTPYIAYGALMALFLTVRGMVLSGTALDMKTGEIWVRALSIPDLIWEYIRLVVLPVQLKALYDMRPGPTVWTAMKASFICAGLYAAWRQKNTGWIRLATLWFFVFLTPVTNIIPLSGATFAERYLYIPMAGAAVLVSGFYSKAACRTSLARPIVLTVLVVFGALTLLRTPIWKNDEALYTHMSKATPTSYKGHYNLGNLRYKQGRLDEATAYWRAALERKPELYAVHNNLGVLYEETGQYELAERHYRAVLAVRTMPEVSINLASVLRKQGRLAEAEEEYRKLLRLSSRNTDAALGLAATLEAGGNKQGALAVLSENADRNPSDYRFWNYAGTLLGEMRQYPEAAQSFERALRQNPSCIECARNWELSLRLAQGRQ